MTDLPHPPVIARDELLGRVARARAAIVERRLDGLVVIGRAFYERPGDLAYLTGHFPPFPTAAFDPIAEGLGHAILVLPASSPPVLHADHPAHWRDLVAIDDVRAGPSPFASLRETLREVFPRGADLGVSPADLMPWPEAERLGRELPSHRLVDASDLLAAMRRRKSPSEIELLRRAASVATAGLTAALEVIAPGVTEADVASAGVAAAIRAGADHVRYFRVHSGPFSWWGSRWPPATSRALVDGDLVAMDAIGAASGYQFDVNRTAASGRLSREQRSLCDAVADAVDRCVEAATAGRTVASLVEVAAVSFRASGFAQHFSGTIGHATGLETIESPYLRRGVDASIQAGDVLCLEPGLFIPDVGGCGIEQIVAVRDHGPPDVLTTMPTRLW